MLQYRSGSYKISLGMSLMQEYIYKDKPAEKGSYICDNEAKCIVQLTAFSPYRHFGLITAK